MKYVITYRTEIDLNKLNSTIYQSQPLNRSTKIFTDLEEAKEFAKTVEVISAWNSIGKKVSL